MCGVSDTLMSTLALILRGIGIASVAYLFWRYMVAAFRVRWAQYAYPNVEKILPKCADQEWQNRCRGCLVGGAIGDALNLPAESIPRWLSRIRYPSGPKMRRGVVRFLRKPGAISDDTQLSIAVARSIDPSGIYWHTRFVDELAWWSYSRIGAGRASSDAAIAARRGLSPKGTQSEGNGAAIRVGPLAIAAKDAEILSELVRENARATHSSPDAVDAAVFVALLIRECLIREPGFLKNEVLFKKTISALEKESKFSLRPIDSDKSPSGHVHQCVPALVGVLSEHGCDFGAAMYAVFRAGGDCDSIGAMVAACIGAQIGYDSLPSQWREKVQHSEVLVSLSDRLANPVSPLSFEGEVEELYGNVALRPVDVIVNAWNRNILPLYLLLPQEVSKAIRVAGGQAAINDVGRTGPLPLGGALESTAGNLNARWVIHADAIDYQWRASEASIRNATRASLRLAYWLGARTVALPILGAGSGSFAPEHALEIVRNEAMEMKRYFDRIELVRFNGVR